MRLAPRGLQAGGEGHHAGWGGRHAPSRPLSRPHPAAPCWRTGSRPHQRALHQRVSAAALVWGQLLRDSEGPGGTEWGPETACARWEQQQQQHLQPWRAAEGPPLRRQRAALAATAVQAPQAPAAAVAGQLVRSRVLRNRRGLLFRIRHFEPSDLLAVADLQAAAFHESLPVGALDKLARTMFKAEVLDALKKKTAVLSPEGFAVMVVERCDGGGGGSSSGSGSGDDSGDECDWEVAVWYGDQQAAAGAAPAPAPAPAPGACGGGGRGPGSIVGVVEVGIQSEADVLQHLAQRGGTYAYISSMAVSPALRRCGVGRALLQAADEQAAAWQQRLVALHVYDSNDAAIRLYEAHGMRCQAIDPSWRGLLGGRVRRLMVKAVECGGGGAAPPP